MPKVVRRPMGYIAFECPGCGRLKMLRVEDPGEGPKWGFNGDCEKPTIEGSIRSRWGEGEAQVEQCCHSFVREGRIEFLGDCTHALAGQTIDLPEVPEWVSR